MKNKKLLLIPLLLLTSCMERKTVLISSPVEANPNNPPVIYTPTPALNRMLLQTAWSRLYQGDNWTRYTQKAIANYGQDLLNSTPLDITKYCPRYSELTKTQKGDFWVHLISKLAYFESSYKPQTTYTEAFSDNQGNPVVSRGLLQISKESANGSHYRCGINTPQELHDSKKNLECGVRILNKWIKDDGLIAGKENNKWRGAARYWSPFRNEEKNSKIMNYTSSLGICR